jgi:hypothetical protein
MKKYIRRNFKALLILFALVSLTMLMDFLPWWSFVVPVLIFGMMISLKGWHVSTFGVGFLCGFLIWSGGSVFFHLSLGGIVMPKMGVLFSVPPIIILIASGIIGGLLTGLALYTGKSVFFKAQTATL